MTTTLNALVSAEQALKRLAAQPVSAKTAYHLARLIKAVFAETEPFHTQRHASSRRCGAERPVTEAEIALGASGTVFEVVPEQLPAYTAQINDLLAVPVTIDRWLLTVTMLGDLPITAEDILALDALISDESPS